MMGLSKGKHTKKLFIGALFAVGLISSLLVPSSLVFADTPSNDSTTDNGTTCAIEKLGWILCPVIETAGKVGDRAFSLLANNFLQTEPELVASFNGGANKPGTYTAWEFARNIANIMFIVAFLIIIMSQVTGQGLNNYGIKKLLPKLIVAAIAVNVSYYICQLMVDLTNILGFEIKNFMIQTAQSVTTSVVMPPQTGIDNQTSNGFLGTVAVAILGIAGIVWFLLPVLFLGVSTVVIASLVIIVILLMRKAFIVLLVVLSPIAFVFYLLPNTERLFQKWLNMFWQLLMVFPVVALLFGSGQLASSIILVAGTSTGADTTYSDSSKQCIQLSQAQPGGKDGTKYTDPQPGTCAQNGRSTPFMLGLVAAGIAVAPLFAVWAVLKGALSAAGAIGGKISGAVQSAGNKANGYAKRPEDWLRKRAGENIQTKWQNMQSRGLNNEGGALTRAAGRRARSRAMRERTLQLAKSDLERSQNQELASMLADPQKSREMTSGLSQQGQKAAILGAQATQDKLQLEEMQAASLRARAQTDNGLEAVVKSFEAGQISVNSPELAAAIDELGKRQNFASLERMMNSGLGKGGSTLANRTLAQTLSQNGGGLFSGGQIAQISRGDFQQSYMQTVNQNIKDGLAPEKLASFNGSLTDEVSRVIRTAKSSTVPGMQQLSNEAAVSMSRAAGELVADNILNKRVSGKVLDRMKDFENGKI